MQKCKSCGAEIIWIKTPTSSMPCDPNIQHYRPNKNGDKIIVTPNGEVIKAQLTDMGKSIGTGYISHFATCPNAAQHRKKTMERGAQERMTI